MFLALLQVAIGGALGSCLRYLTVFAVGAPLATAIINVLGSLVMGLLSVVLARTPALSPLFMTGVLGGFTTFSAFSLDSFRLWQSGAPGWAAVYVAGSVGLSLIAVALGAAFAQRFLI